MKYMKLSRSIIAVLVAVSVSGTGVLPLHADAVVRKKTVIRDDGPAVPYGAPVEFRIPRLGVSGKVEKTTVDAKGALTAPKDPKKVGWYRNGTIPGNKGNAVMLGHVDWYDGPAVFYRLRQVRRGDVIVVTNDRGKKLRFRVTKVKSYADGTAPIGEIAGPADGAHLNVFTCNGTYDRATKKYSGRLVIYTDLVK